MPTYIRSTATCRTCGRKIAFVTTQRGKVMPVDAKPDAGGNVAVHKDVHGVVVSRVVTPELPANPWETLYVPHFATCAPRTLFDVEPERPTNVIPLRRKGKRRGYVPDH